ncbi:MAG: hypothetical protein AAF063_21955 [Cyanobacteria bacterium J06643_5]
MSENNLDELGLFTELTELEQSLISGGISAVEDKLYKSTEQENIADKYTNAQTFDSNQFSISESFAIPEYGSNYLTGSSTLSISADTISSSNFIFSGYSTNQISPQSEIINNLPIQSKQAITQLLETNTDNSFGLSMTSFAAKIHGEENLNISSSRGSISSLSSWSLNVETTALSGLFLSGNQSKQSSSVIAKSDISNLIPEKYHKSINQLLGKRNISDLGLTLTHYSADFQGTQNLEINGLATSAKIISTHSSNIDTAALSGIFVSRKASNSGSLSEVDNPQMIDLLGLESENSLFFSDTSLLDINTTSGILGSTANLSSILQRIEFEDLSENIFLDNDFDNVIDFEKVAPTGGLQFGFSNTYFDSERFSSQSYNLSGEINSLEMVVDSILGVSLPIHNDTPSQPAYLSQPKSDLITNPEMGTSLDNGMNFAIGELENAVENSYQNIDENILFLSDNSIQDKDNSSLLQLSQTFSNTIPSTTLHTKENLSLSEMPEMLFNSTQKLENDINPYPSTNNGIINFNSITESKTDFNSLANQSNFAIGGISKPTVDFTNQIPNTPNLSVAFFDISSTLTTPTNSLELPLNMNDNTYSNYLTILTNRRKQFLSIADRIGVPELSKKSSDLKQKKTKKN